MAIIEVRPTGVNRGATVALHRAMCRRHLEGLQARGVAVKKKMNELKDDLFEKIAFNDLGDKSAKDLKDLETRSDVVSTSLHNPDEFWAETFGVEMKGDAGYEKRCAAPAREVANIRAEQGFLKQHQQLERLLSSGLQARQLAVALDVFTRSLDPATDTTQVGVHYLHEPYRYFRLAGQLAKHLQSIEIPKGFRTYTAPILDDSRYLLTSANTTDAYTVNTSEDPTNSSVTWTPKKLQAVTFWNGEFQEDALYDVDTALKASMLRGFHVAHELALLNGDTTNTSGANINASGGSLTLGTKDPRLAFNGLRGILYRGTHNGKSADTFATGAIDGGGNAAILTDVYDAVKLLGKYAGNPADVVVVCSTQTWFNLRNDQRGSNFGQDVINADIWGMNWVKMANSRGTHAATSNVPTDSLSVLEGCGVNLNASGVFDNVTKTQSFLTLFNRYNYLEAWKRQLAIQVVDLNLGDQKAITSSARMDFQEIIINEPSLSGAFNLI